MRKPTEKLLLALILSALFVFILILILLSDGFYGGGDSIAHYRISHFSFKYPYLFLDHWGKPVFTILSAPFSQLGFNGIRAYNLLAGLLTAFLSYRILKLMNEKNALLVVVFLIFTPVYLMIFFSGLTEVTFSLVLTFSVYLVFKEKYFWSALVISFLPFARTEGIIILPLFALGYLYYKKYVPILILASGFLFFSLIGWPYYDDLLWVIHRMPYSGAVDVYGHGTLFHFVRNMPHLEGLPLLVLFLLGVGVMFTLIFKKGKEANSYQKVLIFIFLPFLAYFSAHSYVWWKGLGSSLGLLRVIAGIVPLAAILSVLGYNLISSKLKNRILSGYVLPVVIIMLVVYTPFNLNRYPMGMDYQQEVLKAAADFVKDSGYMNNRIYYYDLYFQFKLGVDPFDREKCFERIPVKENPGENIPSGSIIQWDAHYGPNEGGLPLANLLNSKNLTLLKKFSPEQPFKVMGGHDYAVYIFQRK